MAMLDILTIVHSFADIQTASRIRRTCRRLATLIPQPTLYNKPNHIIAYEYRVGSKLHRLDGPAQEDVYGYKYWYRGDIAHREYHPQHTNGYYREYIIENVHHRETGPSGVDTIRKLWCLRGKIHRKTGPADTWHGITYWYTLGKRHRLDGPVYEDVYSIRGVEHSISSRTDDAWRINGVFIRA